MFATTVRIHADGDETNPADPLPRGTGSDAVRVGAFGGVIRGSKTRAPHEATAARGTEYFHTSPCVDAPPATFARVTLEAGTGSFVFLQTRPVDIPINSVLLNFTTISLPTSWVARPALICSSVLPQPLPCT